MIESGKLLIRNSNIVTRIKGGSRPRYPRLKSLLLEKFKDLFQNMGTVLQKRSSLFTPGSLMCYLLTWGERGLNLAQSTL